MTDPDLAVTFPSRGVIRVRSRSLFGDADNPSYRRFLERVFQAEEISNVTITAGDTPHAELRFCPKRSAFQDVVKQIVAVLRQGSEKEFASSNGQVYGSPSGHAQRNRHTLEHGHALTNGHASNLGTGIRMAAPLAMLSSLALCANKGILVKDGRALELMNEVDTVLFDKTGTLTQASAMGRNTVHWTVASANRRAGAGVGRQ
jgi:hypothetical protein